MATNRKLVFQNQSIYHIYNRGVERRPTFIDKHEYKRFTSLLEYYLVDKPAIRYSQLLNLSIFDRENIIKRHQDSLKRVEILSYCLMPNHFHLMLRQIANAGISRYLADIINAYTKYFNTRHQRSGYLFGGPFRAVYIETDEQLIHLSRYIHINPAISSLVHPQQLANYQWSSYRYYLAQIDTGAVNTSVVMSHFKSKEAYEAFVFDQIQYAQTLSKIKHLTLEE